MSTIKVNKIENTGTANGGISIDNTGHVQIDGMQMPTAGPLSNRNVIINPEMKVNQRGATVTGNGEFPADRWKVAKNDHGAYSGAQDSDHPPGFGQSIQIACTTAKPSLANGSFFQILQRVEGFDVQQFSKALTGAKPFSVSFWFKTNKQGTYVVTLRDQVNNRAVSHAFNVTAGFTWVQYTHTFPADASGGWPSTNTNALEFQLWLCAGNEFTSGALNTTWNQNTNATLAAGQVNFFDDTGNRCFLTGVQVEAGDMVTPFEHRSMSDELAKCQRYFYKSDPASYAQAGHSYVANGVDGMRVPFCWPVTMRTDPTATISGGTDGSSQAAIEVILDDTSQCIINLKSTDSTTNVWWNGATIEATAEL